MVMVQINSFLADRFNADDFEGTLTLNILKVRHFLANCLT
jgi:hypothetical protein